MATYARQDVSFVQGEGAWLEDDRGQRYLDALGGIAVCALGHAHPAVAEAVARQARTLVHTSNLYRIPLQEALGERLCRASDMERVFFANSGAEANEAALKLARLHGHRRGIRRPRIVAMEEAFHGRTLMTLSATGSAKARAGFEPLVDGFVRVPWNDVAALEALADEPDIVAVLVEPIQGEGGVRIPDTGYLSAIRELCDRQGWLMLCDEIQTGVGRTGYWLASEHDNIRPDVVSLAKALGNGVPIGACLARGEAAEVLGPGTHGSTFGGNPLACAASHAVLDVIEREQLIQRAGQLGARLREGLHNRLSGHPAGVTEIRGRGLMLAVEMNTPCAELVSHALNGGLLINVTAGNVIRLLPPLTLTDDEAGQLIERLDAALRAWHHVNAEEQA